ncbi:hypothetical protein ON010_g2702 [Phytophthora cinnamomi]|nr:hypothetical protein ON010_g2702 [Phytophthora cinnamomi]
MLSLDDLHTLKQIVLDGELGSVNYNRELIAAKLDDSIGFYCDNEFTLSTLNSTKIPLLVFRDAHHKIVLSEKHTPIPKTPAHLYEALGTDDVPTLIHQRAMVTRRRVQSAPPDQYPNTVIIVQRPGDVVYVGPLVYHSVSLGYAHGTPPTKQWGIIDGFLFILREDKLFSYLYATQVNTGTRKNSDTSWTQVLGAYCAMDGRAFNSRMLRNEVKAFTEDVMAKNPEFAKKSTDGAHAGQRSKKRRLSIAHASTFIKK